MTEPSFTTAAAVPTVVVKRTDYPLADMASLFDATFSALFPALAQRGITPTGPAFSLHTRMPSDTTDLEVGLPVSAPLGAPITVGEVTLEDSELPAGNVAHTTHIGGYDGLGDSWGAFMGAIVASGRAPVFPFWEVYTSEPTPDLDPATLRTDLYSLVTDPTEPAEPTDQ